MPNVFLDVTCWGMGLCGFFAALRMSAIVAKTRTQFLCNNCGSVHPKWMGKCPDCGTWDSLEEYKAPTVDTHRPAAPLRDRATSDITQGAIPLPITEIDSEDAPRTPTGVGEFDRILGGGIV